MNKIQRGWRNGLVGLVLPSLLGVSGCAGMGFMVGGYEPVDLSKSRYTSEIKEKADELAESSNERERKEAIKAYGSIGMLKKMDESIKWLIKKSLDSGMSFAEIGDKYHKMHKK